jgi:spore germination protein GerM
VSRHQVAVAALAAALALLVSAGTAGCGVPRDGAPRPLPAEQVDPRLRGSATATPATAGTPTPTPSGSATAESTSTFEVAFVRSDDALTLVPRPVQDGPSDRQAQELLAALEAGPRDAEHDRGLSTALPSGTVLRLDGLEAGTAVVALDSPADADPRRLPLSIAQVVLTLTSHRGIHAVQIVSGGQPAEAPLPDGELVRRPLTASDYMTLLASPAPTP